MEIRFTLHAKDRMRKRGITEDEVIQTIKYPENTSKRGKIYYSSKNIGRAIIEVVYEKNRYINIITIYYL